MINEPRAIVKNRVMLFAPGHMGWPPIRLVLRYRTCSYGVRTLRWRLLPPRHAQPLARRSFDAQAPKKAVSVIDRPGLWTGPYLAAIRRRCSDRGLRGRQTTCLAPGRAPCAPGHWPSLA